VEIRQPQLFSVNNDELVKNPNLDRFVKSSRYGAQILSNTAIAGAEGRATPILGILQNRQY
jgi:hypothetical protein